MRMRQLTPRRIIVIAMAVVWLGLVVVPQASGCPACKLSVPNETTKSADPEDRSVMVSSSAGLGYNLSIMLMMGVPFLLAGSFTGVLYYTMRKGHTSRGDGAS